MKSRNKPISNYKTTRPQTGTVWFLLKTSTIFWPRWWEIHVYSQRQNIAFKNAAKEKLTAEAEGMLSSCNVRVSEWIHTV